MLQMVAWQLKHGPGTIAVDELLPCHGDSPAGGSSSSRGCCDAEAADLPTIALQPLL
jgi:hypothetical protein